ncbi:threonine synthase [Pontiellaceae bacterium B1224]|nr:threonine synthase [Pontiellaceae bacterium B1224]
MNYISTRGQMEPIEFQDAVMTGLAPDGGLLLPESLPNIGNKLEAWSKLSYTELAYEVISLFATDIPAVDLKKLINDSYATFDHSEVCPSVEVGDFQILELFHGPTLAFKDVALQFLGNLFAYILENRGGKLNILGATSGDTGSAAIHGVRGKPNINIFIMHPEGRTSPLQEKQMTSVLDANVFNLAVDGSFDDCQNIMKTTFGDVPFKTEHSLGSVNSVNWARVLAQTVYYFYSAFQTLEKSGAKTVQFSVPTGNFGDILAGYIAQRMGLPISKLILATNENDILSRFFNTGVYGKAEAVPTISPSMDIQVASNFERYLYFKVGRNPEKLVSLMNDFMEKGALSVELDENGTVDELFVAGKGDTAGTLAIIKRYKDEYGYVLDPHTAVGVLVAEKFQSLESPTICLATAHPAKFTQAIIDATGEAVHHPTLDALADAETRCESIANNVDLVKQYVVEHI